MTEQDTISFEMAIHESAVLPDVLERVVSSMAMLANLSIDRVMNALTAIDALVPALVSDVDGESARHVGITASDGRLDVAIERLGIGQAEAILDATSLPDVGDVLGKLATEVRVESDGDHSRLVVSLD